MAKALNWGVWINGVKRLEEERGKLEAEFKQREELLKAQLGRFHKKKVKGKTYWYEAVGKGRWKYAGPEDKNKPTATIEEELRKLERERINALLNLNNAVVSRAGAHLIIDNTKYQAPEAELLDLGAVMEGIRKAQENG